MKLKELFINEKLDEDFILDNFDGAYWESCSVFVVENWNRDTKDLSVKQSDWVLKILDDCVEKRIEG